MKGQRRGRDGGRKEEREREKEGRSGGKRKKLEETRKDHDISKTIAYSHRSLWMVAPLLSSSFACFLLV